MYVSWGHASHARLQPSTLAPNDDMNTPDIRPLPDHSATIEIPPGSPNGMQFTRQLALDMGRKLSGGRGLKNEDGIRAQANGIGWEGATTRSKAGGTQAPLRASDRTRLSDPVNTDGVTLLTPIGKMRIEVSALNRDRRGYRIAIWLL